jgi:putative thioredoxin
MPALAAAGFMAQTPSHCKSCLTQNRTRWQLDRILAPAQLRIDASTSIFILSSAGAHLFASLGASALRECRLKERRGMTHYADRQTEGSAAPSKATTTATFAADVLSESARQPVLVDFWAPWCEPCKQITPLLEKIVKSAGGKIKLVTINIDEHPQIASRLGVRSLPAVVAFQKSQPIDGFVGALPESQIRGFVERLVGPLGNQDFHAEAEAALGRGDAAAAAEIFATLHEEDPADLAALGGLAKSSVALGDVAKAEALLKQAPPGSERDASIAAARAALENAVQAAAVGDVAELERRVAADDNDHQARYDLAIALNARGRRDEAADALLEIIKRDRAWGEGCARKQLLQFFEAWGNMDPATIAARRKLSALLFA